jgi:serine protease AprX
MLIKYTLKPISFLLLMMSFISFTYAQKTKELKYLVYFKDKANTPFSVDKPEEFLSQRAIERRLKNKIEITIEDLPVNPEYVRKVKEVEGVRYLHVSKWFNYMAIAVQDAKVLNQLKEFKFVDSIRYVGSGTHSASKNSNSGENSMDSLTREKALDKVFKALQANKSFVEQDKLSNHYGQANKQIEMLDGVKIHQKGYMGQGVIISVLDAGFSKVNVLPVFDSLVNSSRLLGTLDLVDLDGSVWEDDDHGTQVLSCMAANLPGVMIGTAPYASYFLIRTEDAGSEFPIEESNWVAGAEFSDSLGADIINSSLGYTTFDDASMSYKYHHMDGKTALITRAADKAFLKGIIVMNSAGNEGSDSWKYIGAPADGFHVVSSGGVNANMEKSSFSSFGPTADGRIKPTISAIASQTVVAGSGGTVSPGNGTSFSNPVLSGMMACIVQAAPHKTAKEIIDAVILTGSHFTNPDPSFGYGVPDFNMALSILGVSSEFNPQQDYLWASEYNEGLTGFVVRFYSAHDQNLSLAIQKHKRNGKFKRGKTEKYEVKKGNYFSGSQVVYMLQKDTKKFKSGTYRLSIVSKDITSYRVFTIDRRIKTK